MLAVVAVLVGIMLPHYYAFTAKARRGEARSNIRIISSLQKSYRLDYGVYGTLNNSVGYCSGANLCTANVLENDLGFNPKKCPALRYCYSATTAQAQATHTNGKSGKWVFPNCTETDTLTLVVGAKNITISPDIIAQCE